jgi:hypothetical protein
MKKTKEQKARANRISAIYTTRCSGIQIPIMETVTIMRQAEQAIMLNPGITDADLGDKIAAYVETIRTN